MRAVLFLGFAAFALVSQVFAETVEVNTLKETADNLNKEGDSLLAKEGIVRSAVVEDSSVTWRHAAIQWKQAAEDWKASLDKWQTVADQWKDLSNKWEALHETCQQHQQEQKDIAMKWKKRADECEVKD